MKPVDIVARNSPAVERLYLTEHTQLVKAAYALMHEKDLAEDAVSRVYERLLHAAHLNEARNVNLYAYRTLHNVIKDHWKAPRTKNTLSFSIDEDDIPDRSPDASDEIEGAELEKRVAKLVQGLAPADRRVAEQLIAGHDYEAIMEREHINIGALKMRVFRVRRYFRQALGDEAPHTSRGRAA